MKWDEVEDNPAALRIMRIRGLLAGLHQWQLSPWICELFDVNTDDLELMLYIDELHKQLYPPESKDQNHG